MSSMTKERQKAESLFDRNQRRDTEIKDALKQEEVRQQAVIARTLLLSSPICKPRTAKPPDGPR
jgi:hypothetical protein